MRIRGDSVQSLPTGQALTPMAATYSLGVDILTRSAATLHPRRPDDDCTQDAHRHVDPWPWLPPGRLAASGCAGRRHAACRALRAQCTDCRTRQARHDLLRRWCGHPPGRRSTRLAGPHRPRHARAGADDVAAGACHGHAPRRPGDDRVHHVQRALQPGAQVRHAGPDQQRPRRLECGGVMVRA